MQSVSGVPFLAAVPLAHAVLIPRSDAKCGELLTGIGYKTSMYGKAQCINIDDTEPWSYVTNDKCSICATFR
jgi:hypothetical protein